MALNRNLIFQNEVIKLLNSLADKKNSFHDKKSTFIDFSIWVLSEGGEQEDFIDASLIFAVESQLLIILKKYPDSQRLAILQEMNAFFDLIKDDNIAQWTKALFNNGSKRIVEKVNIEKQSVSDEAKSEIIKNIELTELKEKGKKEIQAYESKIDIRQYPPIRPDAKSLPGTLLKVGDLHGNPLKLMWILIYHGIVKMEPADYKELVDIYCTNTFHSKISPQMGVLYQYNLSIKKAKQSLSKDSEEYKRIINEYNEKIIADCDEAINAFTAEQNKQCDEKGTCEWDEYVKNLHRYNAIIEKAMKTINPKEIGKIYFYGDILGDRGQNELYTFLIMGELIDRNLVDTILASNHDNVFFQLMANLGSFWGSDNPYQRSLNNYIKILGLSLIKFNTQKNGFDKLINKCKTIERKYYPLMKLFDYELVEKNEKTILRLKSHAPHHWFHKLYEAAWHYIGIPLRGKTLTSENYKQLHHQYLNLIHHQLNTGDHKTDFKNLSDLVNYINQKFQQYPVIPIQDPYFPSKKHALWDVIWGRKQDLLSSAKYGLPQEFAGYSIEYEHGHDMVSPPQNGVFDFSYWTASTFPYMRSFDNRLGHGDRFPGEGDGGDPAFGVYTAALTPILPSSLLELREEESKDKKQESASASSVPVPEPSITASASSAPVPEPSITASASPIPVPESPTPASVSSAPVPVSSAALADPLSKDQNEVFHVFLWINQLSEVFDELDIEGDQVIDSNNLIRSLMSAEEEYKETKNTLAFIKSAFDIIAIEIEKYRPKILEEKIQPKKSTLFEEASPNTYIQVIREKQAELTNWMEKLKAIKTYRSN